MKYYLSILLAIGVMTPQILICQEPPLVGSADEAELERALRQRLPAYSDAIFPRQEVLARGVPKAEIPEPYRRHLENSLKKTLNSRYLPANGQWPAWVGLRKLRMNHNYIVGSWSVNADDNRMSQVRVQAWDLGASVTVLSPNLGGQPAQLTQDQVRGILDSVVGIDSIFAISKDKIGQCQVEMITEELAGQKVVYGKMRCGGDDAPKGDIGDRHLWSYLKFLISHGRVCVSFSTIDLQSPDRPASARDRWEF